MIVRKALLAGVVALAAAVSLPTSATAQTAGRAIVSTWHAAPGEQIALLKWLADQDKVAVAAGVPKAQVYVHTDGAEWDYLVVQPLTTPEQEAALEAAGKRLGIDAGLRSSIEFRKHIASHTDTLVRGPMTAADYLGQLGEK